MYNRPYQQGRGPEAIATAYAPVLFGGFGFAYGFWMRTAEELLWHRERADLFWPLLAAALTTALVLPPLAFVLQSCWLHGEHGLVSHAPPDA